MSHDAVVVQLDAHMRFAEQWDETLVRTLDAAEQNARTRGALGAALTAYPPDYDSATSDSPPVCVCCFRLVQRNQAKTKNGK